MPGQGSSPRFKCGDLLPMLVEVPRSGCIQKYLRAGAYSAEALVISTIETPIFSPIIITSPRAISSPLA